MTKQFSVYQPKCPSHNVLEGVSGKWSILLIIHLAKGTARFGELKRALPGISAKMLTQTLQKHERFGFINRVDFNEKSPKVEYSLTALGLDLSAILQTLTNWTELNMEQVLQSITAFDRKSA